jgi:hypothetical protein
MAGGGQEKIKKSTFMQNYQINKPNSWKKEKASHKTRDEESKLKLRLNGVTMPSDKWYHKEVG